MGRARTETAIKALLVVGSALVAAIGLSIVLAALLIGLRAVVSGADSVSALIPIKSYVSVYVDDAVSEDAIDRALARLRAADYPGWEVSLDLDEGQTALTVVGIDRKRDFSVMTELLEQEGIETMSFSFGPTFRTPNIRESGVVFMVLLLSVQLLAFVIVYFLWQRRFPLEKLTAAGRSSVLIGVGVLVGGACLVLGEIVEFVLARIGLVVEEQAWLLDLAGSPVLWAVAPLIVVGAPLGEELFFRGLIFRHLHAGFGTLVGATLSSTIFAGIHFNPSATPIYFLYGFLFAISYLKTRSLMVPIVAHATINTTGVVLLCLG